MRCAALCLALGACAARVPTPPTPDLVHRTGLANNHVAACDDASKCGDGLEPPLGGPHCPSTLQCRVFSTAQNRCQYLHNLEHGHLVLAYNCPSGCPELVDALTAYHAALPPPRRALVTPDPLLRTKLAAVVWGYGWEGDAFDKAKLDLVVAQQDVEAPESGLPCAP